MIWMIGGLVVWCIVVTIVVQLQAERIQELQRRSNIDQDLWRDQIGLNDLYEESITKVEDRVDSWPGRN